MRKPYRVTAVEAIKRQPMTSEAIYEARLLAIGLLARRADGLVIGDQIFCEKDLQGNHSFHEIGVVVQVREVAPVASAC